jgi:hypothetical protein
MTNKKFGVDFEDLKLEGYRNINELYKQHSQLHACETLFGDWNAEVMLLAQDAANFSTLKKLKEEENKNPFRHNPKNNTNINLYKLLSLLNHFRMGDFYKPINRDCGLYYANAIWLLKDSDSMSGAITNQKEAYKMNKCIFEATLKNLPNLKLILTLGKHSFNFIQYYFENQISYEWNHFVEERKLAKVTADSKTYLVGSIFHTSNRGMIARARKAGFSGKSSCAKGIEITSEDLQAIFSSLKSINNK